MKYFHKVKFHTTISVWRRLHGLSLDELSTLTEIAKSTLAFIEAGDRTPSMEQFVTLCNIMQFEPKDFFVSEDKLI
jgi:transcriptional regulator with XRE-family HTH domain